MNYLILGIIIGLLIGLLINKLRVKEIVDDAPVEDSPKNRWLKLQNEGGKYVKLEKGKVKLKILK